MKKVEKAIPSEVLFIILLLIGIILRFIPSTHFWLLALLFFFCQWICVSFVSYSSCAVLQMKDLYCAVLIGCVMILLFHDQYVLDEWFYLLFCVGLSTAYLGCNQRFCIKTGMNSLKKSADTKPADQN